MTVIVWEFRTHPGREAEFVAAYGPKGDWARLFGRSPAFRGTELLSDPADPGRYLTLDRWDDAAVFDTFKVEHGTDYGALDERFESLCSEERLVGRFTTD